MFCVGGKINIIKLGCSLDKKQFIQILFLLESN